MSDVSRETPPTPDAARGVFAPDRLPLAERYAELLATDGTLRGLIGPREVGRLWERHLFNSAAMAEVLPRDATVADIGSGAGLPGLVLAIARPDLRITLVEPLLRRTTFLSEVVEELGLDNVEVVRGRAEALHGQRRFDVVTSRAVAPLPRLLEWSMPLVAPHGALVAMKGSSVDQEIEDASAVLETLGAARPERLEVGAESATSPATLVRVSWADPAQVGSPGRSSTGRRKRSGHRKRRPTRG